tara:strand:+ start:132 stop:311 length:180 start_codon:yes stop_codon:yes gene_type:complete
MRVKRALRFFVLLIFILIGSIVPFPISLHRKDKSSGNLIELKDEEDDKEGDDFYEAFKN